MDRDKQEDDNRFKRDRTYTGTTSVDPNYSDLRRRELLKTGALLGGTVLGLKAAEEGISEIVDVLNGDCDHMTDQITLHNGDAALLWDGEEHLYFQLEEENYNQRLVYGRVEDQKEAVELEDGRLPGLESAYLKKEEYDRASYPIHINLGDAITGGDIVRLKALPGISQKAHLNYDREICLMEKGEANEMQERYL